MKGIYKNSVDNRERAWIERKVRGKLRVQKAKLVEVSIVSEVKKLRSKLLTIHSHHWIK